jgi:hypothetical protein
MSVKPIQLAAAVPHGDSQQIIATRDPATPNRSSGTGQFLALGAAAGVVAAASAYLSTLAAVPVWAMFMGWVAYFTRGHSARNGLVNYLCLALGLLIGFAAAAGLAVVGPVLATFTLPVVVFSVGMLIVSLRALPALSNIPSYFLGVISVFAAHAAPTLEALDELGVASAIGSSAAWLASEVQAKVAPCVSSTQH